MSTLFQCCPIMRTVRRALPLAIVGLGLMLLPVAPRQAESASGTQALATAQTHLSAIIAVQRWAEFAYDFQPGDPGGCEPFLSEPVNNPDGSVSQTFRNADCSEGTVTVKLDGSFSTSIRYPSGLREEITGVASDFRDPPDQFPQLFDIEHRLSSGDRARYQQRLRLVDVDGITFVEATFDTGTLFLANGRRVRFSFTQDFTQPADVLEVNLGKGEKLTWTIATDSDGVPLLEVPAFGNYAAKGKQIDFAITGQGYPGVDGNYERWDLGDGKGLVGQFQLSPDLSGRGQAKRRGKLLFVGNWDKRGRSNLILANGLSTAAGPAAGAQDFGNLKFSGLVVASGPAPGTSFFAPNRRRISHVKAPRLPGVRPTR